MRLVGLLGGTFNPIHNGHLRLAQELADALNFSEVRFIPSANPPHKTAPKISAQHRAARVQLAITDHSLFKLDTRELDRTGASYTIDTLISLQEELGGSAALCLIMGSVVCQAQHLASLANAYRLLPHHISATTCERHPAPIIRRT